MANTPNQVGRRLHLVGATGKIRAAVFNDRPHIVVPVVAMVEGVVHAANSDAPEFVPAESFQKAPVGWNGRPVCTGHPMISGEFVSANDPNILERYSIGSIFNSFSSATELKMEAWVDKDRAAKPGSVGERILQRLENNETLEVSVGAFIVSEERSGNHNGKDFKRVWTDIIPDHLALLSEGDTGACSVNSGCGANRVAKRYLVTAQGYQEAPVPDEPTPKRTIRQRLLDLIKFRTARDEEDMSDSEIRKLLDRALNDSEPAYLGIDSVFHKDSLVVYAVAPSEGFKLLRRGFKLNADGSVSLADDKEEVLPVTTFEPVRAASASEQPQLTANCGCKGAKEMTKEQRVQALIDNAKTPYQEVDRTWLMTVPDDRLTALESVETASPTPPNPPTPKPEPQPKTEPNPQPTPSPAPPTPTPPPPTVNASVAPQTAEQYINMAPSELQESLREGMRAAKARRDSVLSALKGTGRCTLTDEELAGYSTDGLDKLLALSGAQIPVVEGFPQPRQMGFKGVEAPASLIAAIQNRGK
jgi:outer membrane biosynthesis protein TonB